MKRALVLGVLAAGMLAACGGSPGQMRVDTPITKYTPPDIGDITGIDDDSGDSDSDSGSAATPPAPAAAPAAAAAPSGPPPAPKPTGK